MARLSSAAHAARQDDELDVDYSERAGFLVGKSAALADWSHRKEAEAFARLVAVLRVAQWVRANPERKRINARAYWQRNREQLNKAQRLRERRATAKAWKPDTTVRTCVGCGTQWCRVVPKPAGDDLSRRAHGPGPAPKFCTPACWRKWTYAQKKQDPAWVVEHNRRVRDACRAKRAKEGKNRDGG